MIIEAADWYRYALPLTAPLALEERRVSERQGLLVRVATDEGAYGWGDAAPLPGFSTESLSDAIDYVQQGSSQLVGTRLPDSSVEETLRALPLGSAPPSVRFAVEGAVATALADARGGSLASLLGRGRNAIALNALITDDAAEVAADGQRLREAGYRAVKLKVGRRPIEADAARVQALQRSLGDDIALRLDANRAWTMDEACAFMEALGNTSIAYIEEPLADPSGLETFVGGTGCPVALDETTREITLDDLASYPVRAVILKPTLLGGLAGAHRWGRAAHDQGAEPVVSASYESGIGLRVLASLAAALSDVPAGLSTYDRLGDDVLAPRLPLEGPTVPLRPLWTSQVVSTRLTGL